MRNGEESGGGAGIREALLGLWAGWRAAMRLTYNERVTAVSCLISGQKVSSHAALICLC